MINSYLSTIYIRLNIQGGIYEGSAGVPDYKPDGWNKLASTDRRMCNHTRKWGVVPACSKGCFQS